jgi:uncharacterized protein (TIGR02996 family)
MTAMKTPPTRALDAVRAAPDDVAARLVYADWLGEQGDPTSERITLACLEGRTPAQEERLAALLAAAEKSLGKLGVAKVRWDRGLVTWLSIPAVKLARKLDEVFEATPLLSALHLTDANAERLAALTDSPHLARIVSLHVRSKYTGPVGSKGATALAQSAHVGNIKTLICDGHMGGWHLGPRGIKALLAGRLVLTKLDLSENRFGPKGAIQLARASALRTVEELRLQSCQVGDDGVRALAASAHTGALRVLDVGGHMPSSAVTAAGLRALAESRTLPRLEVLGLSYNEIGDDGVKVLLEAKLPALRYIDTTRCTASPAWLAELARRFPLPKPG